jgi:hypothetical protein
MNVAPAIMITTSMSKPGMGLAVGLAVRVVSSSSGDVNGVAASVALNVGEGVISLVGPGDEGETVSVGDEGTGVFVIKTPVRVS